MKKTLQLLSLIFLVSCAGHAPQMERKVKIWNGAPEEAGICRLSTANLKNEIELNLPDGRKIQLPLKLFKKVHQGYLGTQCLQATDPSFEKYACLTFDDLGVLYDYIEKLIYSCKKW